VPGARYGFKRNSNAAPVNNPACKVLPDTPYNQANDLHGRVCSSSRFRSEAHSHECEDSRAQGGPSTEGAADVSQKLNALVRRLKSWKERRRRWLGLVEFDGAVFIAERLGKSLPASRCQGSGRDLDVPIVTSHHGAKPVVRSHWVQGSEDKNIVLVDDVLFTGRTTRAALDALFSHGRPQRVQLCVLIDRGHREIPVEATFVGRIVQTTMNEVIEVKLTEIDDAEKVLLMEK
jgi:pyrimidine operon attenuation protein/uracil phosphoribosyltransferase